MQFRSVWFIFAAAAIGELLAGCAVPLPTYRYPVTSAEPGLAAPDERPVGWALVLSSGSIRGLAHFGVLKVLAAEGLMPDLIVGTSAGAIVGAVAASGASADDLDAAAANIGTELFMDWTIPQWGLIAGENIHDFVDRHTKSHRIEAFPVRFAAVTVEAERSCLHVLNTGDPGKAVQASSSVPVFVSPAQVHGKRYLDGALISPLPVRVARALGAERVVAVDVTFDPKERTFTGIVEAFWRTTLVMRWALTAAEAIEADLLIAPVFPAEPSVTLANRQDLVARGERAARAALPALRTLLLSPPPARYETLHPALTSLLCTETRSLFDGGRAS